MTSYDYITFDPIGLFQRNRFSKIVSLKNTLQYKFLKELTVEDLQDDKKALEKLNKCWKVFVRYLKQLEFETMVDDLIQYPGLKQNFHNALLEKMPDLVIENWVDIFQVMKEYSVWWQDNLTAFENIVDKFKIQLDDEYYKFIECVETGTEYEGFTINKLPLKILRTTTTEQLQNYDSKWVKEKKKNMVSNLSRVSYYLSNWLHYMSDKVINWLGEFKKLYECEQEELQSAIGYINGASFLEIDSYEKFAYDMISFCRNSTRQAYFTDNFYNVKLLTARIGGLSILQWIEQVYFKQKDSEKGFYNTDKVGWFVNQYLVFAKNLGYDIGDTDFVDFINTLVKQYVPLDQYAADEWKEKFDSLTLQYNDLKEKFDVLYEELPKQHKSIALKLIDCIENLDGDLYQRLMEYLKHYKESFDLQTIEALEFLLQRTSEAIESAVEAAKQQREKIYQVLIALGKQVNVDVERELANGNNFTINDVADFIMNQFDLAIMHINSEIVTLRNEKSQDTQTINNQNQTIEKQNQAIAEKDQAIINQNQTIEKQNQAIINQNQAIEDKEKEIKLLKQKMEETKKTAEELIKKDEYISKSEKYLKLVKDNQDLKKLITEIKKKNEELSNQINNSLQQFEMNQIKAKELKDKEDNLNKKEANLKDKEANLKDKEVNLNEQETKIDEKVKNGNELLESFKESVDKRLEELIIHLPADIGPDIRNFRTIFFQKFKESYPNIVIKFNPEHDSTNDIKIGSKTVIEWHEYYLDKVNTKVIEDDFNPEGTLVTSTQRVYEEQQIMTLIRDQKSRGVYLDFTSFKLAIINCAFDESQRRYFKDRFNHIKIGTAIFGTKTIDEWYTVLASVIFSHEE